MISRIITATLFTSIIFFVGCKENNTNHEGSQFNLLSDRIDFTNTITESDSLNYFMYPYIYFGGGVSIGDINNDGLSDIYFVGNMTKNKLYLNQGNMKFKDISESAGVEGDDRWMNGSTMADVNNDGYLDIYISVSGRYGSHKNMLYINTGNSEKIEFKEMAEEYGVADSSMSIQSAFFDYDKDGDLDLLVGNYPPARFRKSVNNFVDISKNFAPIKSDHLYENQGGKFIDVTEKSGLSNYGLTIGISISDLNNDGWEDIYLSNDFATPDRIFINQKDGTFKNVLNQSVSHTALSSMGTDIADYNNDGLYDIIQVDMVPENNQRSKENMASMDPFSFHMSVKSGFHYQYMQNCLQLNRGNNNENIPIFSDVSWMAGIALTDWSWSVLFADLNNDSYKDVFVTNGTRREVNNKDYIKKFNLDTKFTKNPDYLEYSLGMPSEKINNFTFMNNGDLTFTEKEDWGLNFIGFSSGAAYADLDNDGDLDMVINNLDSISVIYENKNKDQNNYIQFKLKGDSLNTKAIGAEVTLYSNQTQQKIQVQPTRGFQSSSDYVVHFGLGKSTTIDSVQIQWPDRSKQVISKNELKINSRLEISYSRKNVMYETSKSQIIKPFFQNLTEDNSINFNHTENEFDDFLFQVLAPHKFSQFGPALAVGDVNGDQLTDVFFGNAHSKNAELFIQNKDHSFSSTFPFPDDSNYEDLDASFVDLDGDGDLDLYLVSGGNEFEENDPNYTDRIYVNDGNGNFKRAINALPENFESGSVVRPFDYDQDGDLDLFVGSRLVPRKYPLAPQSHLYENQSTNGKIHFVDVTEKLPKEGRLGLVTDAVWSDINQDGNSDLLVVGEWMPLMVLENHTDSFVESSEKYGMDDTYGWWFSIEKADLNGDGKEDYVLGNLGLNYKYRASEEAPFEIFADDFDNNNSMDIVLSYYQDGLQFPVRGKQCSSEQLPDLKYKFSTYKQFGASTIYDIYGEEALLKSLHYKVKDFASSVFISTDTENYTRQKLPMEAQISNINDIVITDINCDTNMDLIIAGNLYVSEVETTRNDASVGLLLVGDGQGNFESINSKDSKLIVPQDTKKLATITINNNNYLIMGNNNSSSRLVQIFNHHDCN